ncbi:glycoside hydrolase family 20 zincin-like fold domain-containing protein [candidate division KSB1 bacterium]
MFRKIIFYPSLIWLTLVFGLAGVVSPTLGQKRELNLIPEPKETTMRSGEFLLDGSIKILLGPGTSDADSPAAADLRTAMGSAGVDPPEITTGDGSGERGKIILLGDPESSAVIGQRLKKLKRSIGKSMSDEGYVLDITPNRVIVAAASAAGRYYGAQTLRQLIENGAGSAGHCPALTIRDWPDFKLRGVSDDMSRGQVSTLKNLKDIVSRLAHYKMNCYMPYIEDIFEFSNYPSIGQGRGRLTKDEMRELDRYARERYVQIIPIFQSLGHYENILLNPKFRALAEFPGAHTLAIANPDIYTFLQNALTEVAETFSSPYVHVGCDESWDVGRGATSQKVFQEGLHKVHAEHYLKVYDIVKKLGKKPIMYGDIPLANPGILPEIPKDITIVDWHYGPPPPPQDTWPSVQKFREAGFPVIVSPGVSNWTRLFPDYTRAEINIRTLTAAGRKQSAVGAITSNWGDFGGDNLRELVWYGHLFAAAVAWNGDDGDPQRFRKKFFPRFFGIDSPELSRAFQNLIDINDMASFWEFRAPSTTELTNDNRTDGRIRGRRLEKLMDAALADIEAVRDKVKRNADQLDYWHFSALRGKWIARHIWMGAMIRELSYESRVFETGVKGELMSFCERLKRDIPSLKQAFESLWLKTNRPEGLAYNLSWYDYHVRVLTDQYQRFEEGNYEIEPFIGSSWVAFPEVLPPGRPSNFRQVFFRHHFRRSGRVRRANLQITGDSHVEVYLNGRRLGELLARPSLSGVVETDRVRIFDISENLRRGDNVIAISVRNFDLRRPGVNVYSEVESANGEVQVISSGGTDWTTTIEPVEAWQSVRFDDRSWRPAEIYNFRDSQGRSFALSKPVLKENIPSIYVRLSL